MLHKHMPHTHEKAFNPKLLSFSNKLYFDVGNTLTIIQPESEKTIHKANFYNVSDFKIKNKQRFRFWFKKTRQFLNWKNTTR